MSKKKLLVIIAVVAAMAIAASVAYGWFTANAQFGASASAGTLTYSAGDGISASGLMPQNTPALAGGTGPNPTPQYFWVQNNSTASTMFFGYVDDYVESVGGLGDKVMVKVWLAPTDGPYGTGTFNVTGGPHAVYQGPLSGIVGAANGKWYLSSRTAPGGGTHTPFGAGQVAVYKIILWLDSSAGDGFQGAWLTCNVKFWGTQEEAWVD